MTTENSIAAVRGRIQRLVEEIAALAKEEIPSEQFFTGFIERAAVACDARGGAVWLAGAKSGDGGVEFQLCAQVGFESSLFQTDEQQRATILRLLTQVVADKKPVVLGAAPETGVIGDLSGAAPRSQNRTPFPFVHVPIFLQNQAAGVLQVWLQPYVAAESYGEFVTFLSSLGGYVEKHLQSRRLGGLMLESQRLQHLLRFAGDLAGCLDALEVARLTANYARDLSGCERCSVLVEEAGHWKVLAISGQETVEPRSTLVKAIAAFASAHCRPEIQLLNKRELLPDAAADAPGAADAGKPDTETPGDDLPATPAQVADAIDIEYFEHSRVLSAMVAPILDAGQEIRGALFLESTKDGHFEGPSRPDEFPAAYRLAQWMGSHGGKALLAARDYESLPFLKPARALRSVGLALSGTRRKRTLFRLALGTAAALVIAFWPVKWKTVGECTLLPSRRAAVVSEIAGTVQRVFVKEGDAVEPGTALAQLDTRRLETELEAAVQEKFRHLAEADRFRAPPLSDEASAQVAQAQAAIAGETEKRIRADIASASLRSPIAGVVLTKSPELRAGEYLQPGSLFAEIGGIDRWELHADVDERDIGLVERFLADKGSLPLPFILYAETAHRLEATLSDRQQISAAAQPREKKNVFVVTVKDPPIPGELLRVMRPGLTGKAKVELAVRPLSFVVAHNIASWFRLRWINL